MKNLYKDLPKGIGNTFTYEREDKGALGHYYVDDTRPQEHDITKEPMPIGVWLLVKFPDGKSYDNLYGNFRTVEDANIYIDYLKAKDKNEKLKLPFVENFGTQYNGMAMSTAKSMLKKLDMDYDWEILPYKSFAKGYKGEDKFYLKGTLKSLKNKEDIHDLHYKFPAYNPPINLAEYKAPMEFKAQYPFKSDYFIHSEHKYRIPGEIIYSDGVLEIKLKENKKEIEVTVREVHPDGYKDMSNIETKTSHVAFETFDNEKDLNSYLLGIKEKFKSYYRSVDEIYQDLQNKGLIKKEEPIIIKDINGREIKVGDMVRTKQPSGGVLPPGPAINGIAEDAVDPFGNKTLYIRYREKGRNFDQFIDISGQINEVVSEKFEAESFHSCLSRNGINLEKDHHKFDVGTIVRDNNLGMNLKVIEIQDSGCMLDFDYALLKPVGNVGYTSYAKLIEAFNKGALTVEGFLPEEKMEFARVLNSIQHCRKMDALKIENEKLKIKKLNKKITPEIEKQILNPPPNIVALHERDLLLPNYKSVPKKYKSGLFENNSKIVSNSNGKWEVRPFRVIASRQFGTRSDIEKSKTEYPLDDFLKTIELSDGESIQNTSMVSDYGGYKYETTVDGKPIYTFKTNEEALDFINNRFNIEEEIIEEINSKETKSEFTNKATLTPGIEIGDEYMWHGGPRVVVGFDDMGNVDVEELDDDEKTGRLTTVSTESFLKEASKFPKPNKEEKPDTEQTINGLRLLLSLTSDKEAREAIRAEIKKLSGK